MKNRMMLLTAILTLSTGVFSGVARADDQQIPDFYRLRPATVKEVVPTAAEIYSDFITPPVAAQKQPAIEAFTIDWSTIVTIGEKIIEIVKAGKPVVNVTRDTIAAVPGGVSSWTQLSGWQAPITKVYSLTAENNLGMTIVDMRLKVSANTGGGIDGKGKFIANLVVVPSSIYVLWGFNADVSSSHQEALNMGQSDNPIAGMGFDINYKYSSPLFVQQGTQSYFVTGDGVISAVQ
jgi:hypothetical protein